jgi:hypothetical protein
MHLDLYHRINVDPCSLTVIRYTERRPFVLRLNDLGDSIADLLPAAGTRAAEPPPAGEPTADPAASAGGGSAESDAVIGGGAGAYQTRVTRQPE